MKKYKVKKRVDKLGSSYIREDIVIGPHNLKIGDGVVFTTCPPTFETVISIEPIEIEL